MKLLLLEFNEIDGHLVERGIALGNLPTFARLRAEAECFETDAGDSYLEPWVQWVTLHTGVPLARHGAVQLALGPGVPQPFVWETLSAAGHRVWVCGALNGRDRAGLRGAILLDYWAPAVRGSPFFAFQRFVNACVSRHIDERHRLPWREAAGFLSFMLRRGLRPATMARAAGHAAAAALTRTPWRVVFALEDCQLDLFFHERRRLDPAFGVLFVNSVAHLQHNYWREAEPERFAEPPAAHRRRHAGAIAAGYRHLDRLLARLLDSVGPQTTVLLCSALGQEPYRQEGARGPTLYRVDDLSALVRALALPNPASIARHMADAFTLHYADEPAARAARDRLAAARIGRRRLFRAELRGKAVLVDGSLTFESDPSEPVMVGDVPSGFRLGDLARVGHHVGGVHHRRGLLWIRGRFPRPAPGPGRPVPLTAIAPLIETFFDVRSAGPREGS